MKFAFAFISSCLVFSDILLVDGRRLMNSVGNPAGRKCTINEITSRSVDDFCNELSEIMDFRTQMSEIKKSLAEISSTLDVLSKATSTTPEPTDINQDCEGVWSPCTSSCETAGNRTFQISHQQLGAGKPCQDATDCLSGEDECAGPDPTLDPTIDPTIDPTLDPEDTPTSLPTADPTLDPTVDPTIDPTLDPTMSPTFHPSNSPSPTHCPSLNPSFNRIFDPTTDPTLTTSFQQKIQV